MRIILKSMGETLWKVVDEGFVILNEANPTQADNKNILVSAQAMNVIICALYIHDYHRVYKLETAHEMWGSLLKLMRTLQLLRVSNFLFARVNLISLLYCQMKNRRTDFSHLNNIVNELKDFKFDVLEVDISHKFFRALPTKYETIVTFLVRSDLKKISPSEVLVEVLTHDIFKQSQEKLHSNHHEDKKKIIAIKVKTSSDDDHDGDNETSTDDAVVLMVKKFMKKKYYQGGSSKDNKSNSKNHFAKKKCFECCEMGHISTNCKNKDEDNSSKKLFKKYNKKKNGKGCYVEWDSDVSSDSDSSDDDDVKPSKKGLVGIAIKEAPSPFDTPYYFMAKGEPKVSEIDELTYDDLVKMVINLDDLLGDMKEKYKSLRKKYVSLQESYEELKTSHENLLDTHEKFKEAHNFHISQETNKVNVDVGITCDLIDDMPKIDKVSNSSISTSCDDLLTTPSSSNVDSCMNDSSCDPLLIVESHELRNIMDCLTKALANYHRSENTYNMIWECQNFTLKHEGLGIFSRRTKVLLLTKRSLS
jgi:hypothetical protein